MANRHISLPEASLRSLCAWMPWISYHIYYIHIFCKKKTLTLMLVTYSFQVRDGWSDSSQIFGSHSLSLCQADGVGPPYRHRVRNGRQHGDLSGEQRFMGMEHDELHPPKPTWNPKIGGLGWCFSLSKGDILRFHSMLVFRGCRHFGSFEWLEKLEASE